MHNKCVIQSLLFRRCLNVKKMFQAFRIVCTFNLSKGCIGSILEHCTMEEVQNAHWSTQQYLLLSRRLLYPKLLKIFFAKKSQKRLFQLASDPYLSGISKNQNPSFGTTSSTKYLLLRYVTRRKESLLC